MTNDNLKQFRQLSKLLNEDASLFEIDKCIEEISNYYSEDSIKNFLLLLNDDYDYEIMFSLIHAAEQYADDVYVKELLEIIPEIYKKAPDWSQILIIRCLNSRNTYEEMLNKFGSVSHIVKIDVIRILNDIIDDDPSFSDKVAPLIVKLT